jgi:hypothetical protein
MGLRFHASAARCFFIEEEGELIEEEGKYLQWTERQIGLFVPKVCYPTWRYRTWY